MHTQNIIERAFELAREATTIDDIRRTLRQEGYANVDAHLAGASIKADLKKQFKN
jgi:tRNA G26 N,N-dimethylase Trm1